MNDGGVSDMNTGPDEELWEAEEVTWRDMLWNNNPIGPGPELEQEDDVLLSNEVFLLRLRDHKPPAKPRSVEYDVNSNHFTLRGPRGIRWRSSTDDPVWTTKRVPRSFAGRGRLRVRLCMHYSYMRLKLRETSFLAQILPPKKHDGSLTV